MKKILKKLINLFGYEINKSRGQRINMRQSLLHLKENGYKPKLIVDVGVADGTPEIYEIFPESKFLLVEPLDYFQKSIINYPSEDKSERETKLIQTIDYLNNKFKNEVITWGIAKKKQSWSMNRKLLSGTSITNIEKIPTIII